MDVAAENGHFEVVMWLHEHRYGGRTAMAMSKAARNGHLKIIQWFHVHYLNTCMLHGMDGMDGAAEKGHLDIGRWLHENRREGCRAHALDFAVRKGHLDVVLYLMENRDEGFLRGAMVAAQDIEVRCFLGSSDNIRPNDSMSGVRSDHLSLLRAAFSRKPDFVRGCLRCSAKIAVEEGNIELLDWLNQFGLELRSAIPIRDAVSRGHVKLLQWFHQNGLEVRDPDLLELAVEKGQLNVARWLSKRGYMICLLKLVEVAQRHNNVPLLRWIVEHGPISREDFDDGIPSYGDSVVDIGT